LTIFLSPQQIHDRPVLRAMHQRLDRPLVAMSSVVTAARDLIDKRRELAQEWSRFCNAPEAPVSKAAN
jgi:hypothetical protein